MPEEKFIEISNEDLFKIIPWFAGFIDMGRMGYRMDLSSDELAEQVVNYWIKKKRKEEFKIIKGFENANSK
ncbi:MAG: hypothetical protein IKU37_03645 [Candidatus Gastranaerophilales bacterium]|nr:hypothetical protein [Candidatus Gastranaerophilales bacterium]